MNNHAKLGNSDRLQKALELLLDRKWHTTLEISQAARTVAAGSCISELRTNGLTVIKRWRQGRSDESRRVCEYRLGGA